MALSTHNVKKEQNFFFFTIEKRIIQSSHQRGCLRSYRESRRRLTDTRAMTVTPVTVAIVHGCKSLELLAIFENWYVNKGCRYQRVARLHVPRLSARHDAEVHELSHL